MKTTLRVEDSLFRRAKIRAVEEGCTLSELVERGLRMVMNIPGSGRGDLPARVSLPVIDGGQAAGVEDEMTPARTAEILNDQETDWAR